MDLRNLQRTFNDNPSKGIEILIRILKEYDKTILYQQKIIDNQNQRLDRIEKTLKLTKQLVVDPVLENQTYDLDFTQMIEQACGKTESTSKD